MLPTKTQAIKTLLSNKTHADLSQLYNYEMEVQVNVSRDNGQKIEGIYEGARWRGWSDGVTTWKPFRIPYNANTEPSFEDKEMKFDLAAHAEGIGMTGWNWVKRLSLWVAFDFDAIVGHSDRHSKKLTEFELIKVREAVENVPWITLRYSTSGKGLHLYAFIKDVLTSNHNEHAALARSVLSSLSATTGFDFVNKVDICGGNMWVWHRKMQGNGLKVIKQGTELFSPKQNWRDNVPVITGRRKKSLPKFVELDESQTFDELTGKVSRIPLDNEHKKLFAFLDEINGQWWWDQDNHMLVAHTSDLKEAHIKLNYKGKFETLAQGTERGSDHNCFAFPMRRGAWAVRRYSPGVTEAATWDQDGSGWTRCFLNREIDFATACKINNGLEHPTGGYHFNYAEQAEAALALLGSVANLDSSLKKRDSKLKRHKEDGKIIFELEAHDLDKPDLLIGWIREGKKWKRVFTINLITNLDENSNNYDDIVRHIVTEDGTDCGWVINSEGQWREEPLVHVKLALNNQGLSPKEVTEVLGSSIIKPWILVNIPFTIEYPGDRRWNRNAAQLNFLPSINSDELKFPTFNSILSHLGKRLDAAVLADNWCKQNNILTGADYLRVWIACLFQFPEEPLPYLFFFSQEQNTGKSIFHEMLGLLITNGYVRADHALTSSGSFNAELENAVICCIEETDLRQNKNAYNRIKDWVTSRYLSIHKKGSTPYQVPNTTHYVQCSNYHLSCPVFPGDSRIVAVLVYKLENIVPKKELLQLLKSEAPDFLSSIMNMEIPISPDRLRLPVINTEEKELITESNKTHLEMFIEENCLAVDGHKIPLGEFYEKFMEWIDPNEQHKWTKIRISKEMPVQFVKGRDRLNAQWCYANISFDKTAKPAKRYYLNSSKILVD
jgi:hypothetical protein